MDSIMVNSYMQVISGGQRLKEKIVQTLRNAEDEYNGVTWTTVAFGNPFTFSSYCASGSNDLVYESWLSRWFRGRLD